MPPFMQLELFSRGLKIMRSIFKTIIKYIFPPPSSVKKLEDVHQEEWYKILLETVQNLYESISRRIAAVLKAKMVQHHIHKEICIVSVVFQLFYLTPVCIFHI
jgi:hypothetical protein